MSMQPTDVGWKEVHTLIVVRRTRAEPITSFAGFTFDLFLAISKVPIAAFSEERVQSGSFNR